MFARIVEFTPKPEKKEEFVKVVRNEVLPILKKQPGFLEILPFEPETKMEKSIIVALWAEKRDAERYEREVGLRSGRFTAASVWPRCISAALLDLGQVQLHLAPSTPQGIM